MRRTRALTCTGILAAGLTLYLAASRSTIEAQPSTGGAVRVDSDDIGGVVTSTKGPEAGVWVIAETTGLPTRYIKEVVTDDRGRYLIPDLPKAKYTVWARGMGWWTRPKWRRSPAS